MHLLHPYHIVSPSPWPFYLSFSLLSFFINLVSSSSLLFPSLLYFICYFVGYLICT